MPNIKKRKQKENLKKKNSDNKETSQSKKIEGRTTGSYYMIGDKKISLRTDSIYEMVHGVMYRKDARSGEVMWNDNSIRRPGRFLRKVLDETMDRVFQRTPDRSPPSHLDDFLHEFYSVTEEIVNNTREKMEDAYVTGKRADASEFFYLFGEGDVDIESADAITKRLEEIENSGVYEHVEENIGHLFDRFDKELGNGTFTKDAAQNLVNKYLEEKGVNDSDIVPTYRNRDGKEDDFSIMNNYRHYFDRHRGRWTKKPIAGLPQAQSPKKTVKKELIKFKEARELIKKLRQIIFEYGLTLNRVRNRTEGQTEESVTIMIPQEDDGRIDISKIPVGDVRITNEIWEHYEECKRKIEESKSREDDVDRDTRAISEIFEGFAPLLINKMLINADSPLSVFRTSHLDDVVNNIDFAFVDKEKGDVVMGIDVTVSKTEGAKADDGKVEEIGYVELSDEKEKKVIDAANGGRFGTYLFHGLKVENNDISLQSYRDDNLWNPDESKTAIAVNPLPFPREEVIRLITETNTDDIKKMNQWEEEAGIRILIGMRSMARTFTPNMAKAVQKRRKRFIDALDGVLRVYREKWGEEKWKTFNGLTSRLTERESKAEKERSSLLRSPAR